MSFGNLIKNLVGLSYEDLGKFSKNLSVFGKFLILKLVENLVEFSLENFDILIKIGICENMLGFVENEKILGFLVKKNYELFENLVGLSENVFCDFQKKLCQP